MNPLSFRLFPFQLPASFSSKQKKQLDAYEELDDIVGSTFSSRHSTVAPSLNLRALLISHQNRERKRGDRGLRCPMTEAEARVNQSPINPNNQNTEHKMKITTSQPIKQNTEHPINQAVTSRPIKQTITSQPISTEDGVVEIRSETETEKTEDEERQFCLELAVSEVEALQPAPSGWQLVEASDAERMSDPISALMKRTETDIKEGRQQSLYGAPHHRRSLDVGQLGQHRRSVDQLRHHNGNKSLKLCSFRSLRELRLHNGEPAWLPTFKNRVDVLSQFAPYDDNLNTEGYEDRSISMWEILRFGWSPASGWSNI